VKGPITIAAGIYGLGSEGVNWYLVEDGGRLTAVDAGLPNFSKALEADLRTIGHAADDETLRKPGPKKGEAAPVRALPRVAWRWRFWMVMGQMTRAGGAKPPKIEDAETFVDGDVLDVPGRPRAIHTPGHTDGHCVLLFEGRSSLFVGDALCTVNFFTGRLGPQLMPGPTNVSTSQALDSLAAIEPLDARLLLPGHGEQWHGSPAAAVGQARAAL
jgi:glyoxylase-like metal-dependent hydrolase (beta-lactamase superfamily II)